MVDEDIKPVGQKYFLSHFTVLIMSGVSPAIKLEAHFGIFLKWKMDFFPRKKSLFSKKDSGYRTIQGEKQCKDASVWRGPGSASQVKLNLIKISVESKEEETQETSENNFVHAQVPQAQHSNTAQPGGEGSQKQSDRGRAFQV